MIGLTYADALFFYVLLYLITIAVLWVRELVRNRAYRWESGTRRVMNCPACHVSFIAPDNANVTRCPRCNSICFYRKR